MPKRKTHEEFICCVEIKNPNTKILGRYVSALTKIDCECKICGHRWSATPNNLLKGKGCFVCKGQKISKSRTKSHDSFIYELKKVNQTIDILGEYRNSKAKIQCKCRICGNVWNTIPSSLLRGHGCPRCGKIKCANSRKKSQEQFVLEMRNVNSNIEIIGKYIDDSTKVGCRCLICGNIWSSKPTHLLQKHGCPNCMKSNGEDRIEEYLQRRGISYIYQKRFDDLRGVSGRKLSYDFYIPSYNLLIEFNGEQHERPIEYFGGEEKFKIQREHDGRKAEYAKKHHITLLQIWYYDFDKIEDILKSHLADSMVA